MTKLEMGRRPFAQVIVDIVHENVARTFSYRIPDGMKLSLGQRVEVPFARMIKEGVVVGSTEECDVPPVPSSARVSFHKAEKVARHIPLAFGQAVIPALALLLEQ